MTSAVKWSPFAGMKMAGFVRATYVRGRKVFENGQCWSTPAVASSSSRTDTQDQTMDNSVTDFIEKLTPALAGLFQKIRVDSATVRASPVTRSARAKRKPGRPSPTSRSARGSKPSATMPATCISPSRDKARSRQKS